MTRLVLGRTASLFLVLAGVLLMTFVMSRVLPGSPATLLLGAKPTAEQIAAARDRLGLDLPMPQQFVRYLADVARGDLGISLRSGRPIAEEGVARAAATFELVIPAMLLAVLAGVPLGLACAIGRGRWLDQLTRPACIAAVAMPGFMIGIFAQLLFHGTFDWLPLQGRLDARAHLGGADFVRSGFLLLDAGRGDVLADVLRHLVLPVLTLGLPCIAVVARVTRAAMIEVLGQDHVLTARAYAVPRGRLYFHFALKAALNPILTTVGLTFGYMLGGSIVVEYVFDWPGLGGYTIGAVVANDYPVVMAVTVFLAACYLAVNLAVDLLYAVVDPRLRA